MNPQAWLVLKSAALFVATAVVLAVLFHLVGLNSNGWMVLILLAAATAGLLFYRHNKPNVTAVP